MQLYADDLAPLLVRDFRKASVVAIDIETSGLDWSTDRIGACTFFAPGNPVALVRTSASWPRNICALLADTDVRKIFHHAMFDLRFMAHRWKVEVANVACTKIAAKLLDPAERRDNSLKGLVERYVGRTLDKSLQTSNWVSPRLSRAQKEYAAHDVIYLPELLDALLRDLTRARLARLTEACFHHIPARVQLDIHEYKDVFTY